MACPKNACAGGYGPCLDVKITNKCNGACSFCIEKNGYSPFADKTPTELALATVAQHECENVLILGGEPTLYDRLLEYIELIRPYKKGIYMTTNGSMLPYLNLKQLGKLLDGINISMHHYDEDENNRIFRGGKKKTQYGSYINIRFRLLKDAIAELKAAGCPVRINCNLVKGGIDSRAAVLAMIDTAVWLGANSIRFSELQDEPELTANAYELFDGLPSDPFQEGCETELAMDNRIKTVVKVSCGRVNKTRPAVKEAVPGHITKVLYPNGEVNNGWRTAANRTTEGCHTSCDGCH